MNLSNCLFDTQVYIAYDTGRFKPGWLSAVVLQELTVGASGSKELKAHQTALRDYQSRGRLIVPDAEAWYLAGRTLNVYLSDLSRADCQQRRRPGLDHGKKQNLIRDVLIAVSAKRSGVTVISDNDDFPTILRHYKFSLLRAKEFFA
ncbi:MAG: hypothetical protein ABI977_05510 [Acidobacteriota bacterium]